MTADEVPWVDGWLSTVRPHDVAPEDCADLFLRLLTGWTIRIHNLTPPEALSWQLGFQETLARAEYPATCDAPPEAPWITMTWPPRGMTWMRAESPVLRTGKVGVVQKIVVCDYRNYQGQPGTM